jgi:hypothetical protein
LLLFFKKEALSCLILLGALFLVEPQGETGRGTGRPSPEARPGSRQYQQAACDALSLAERRGRIFLARRCLAVRGAVCGRRSWVHLRAFVLALLLACPLGVAARAADFAMGDYLEDGFLATLRSTRSPWAAVRHGPERGFPQGISIQPQGDGVRFDGNFNWHEGCALFSVTATGAIRPGERGYCGFAPHRLLRVDRPGHLLIAFGTRRLGYSRVGAVGSMDRFVAVVAIGGRYRDASGKQVVFEADGLVSGLVPEGPYRVSLDHIMEPFDSVVLGNNAARYGFRWVGGALVLYPMRRGAGPEADPWGRPDDAHPFRVLVPIREGRTGRVPGRGVAAVGK